MYTSFIYVGNPPQKLRALFDTGSSNTWIASDKLKNSEELMQKKHSLYSPGHSNSSRVSNETIERSFGTGKCKGVFTVDDIRLGLRDEKDPDINNAVLIKDYKFLIMTEQTDILGVYDVDAIIGMSYSKLAVEGVTPIVEEMMQQKSLKNNIFAYSFVLKNEEKEGLVSDMTLGYYDKSKFVGDIKWHPVVKKHFFAIKLDDVLFNGKTYGLCKYHEGGCMMTIDSGFTYMGVPEYMNNFMKKHNLA